jgi:hypothetical protein
MEQGGFTMTTRQTWMAAAAVLSAGLAGCADGAGDPGNSHVPGLSADGGVPSQESELFGNLDGDDPCVGGRGGFFADLMCRMDLELELPYGSDVLTLGVLFEVPDDGADRFEELTHPLCAPERRLAVLRSHWMHDTPLPGIDAHETWIDLRASQFGVEGWRNQGMFIPEDVRWFYEPTAGLGGWKKQYVSETRWDETDDGWQVTSWMNGEVFARLEFRRGELPPDVPSYLKVHLDQPLDLEDHPEPHYVLQPADFDPTLYDTVDPVVYDSRWTPQGPVDERVEVGTVRLTWARPAGTDFDLRWMDLLPPSGTELPGYLVHKVPDPDTTDQLFTHRSTGYGECAPWR